MSMRKQEVPRHDAGAQALSSSRHRDVAALEASLQPDWPGVRVEWVDQVDSTNTALAERLRRPVAAAVSGAPLAVPGPAVLIADRQTSGRGRLGRRWQSEAGASLTFSMLLPLAAPDWSGLSLAVGLALAESLDAHAPVALHAGARLKVMLKWPNDLWLVEGEEPGRKLGGVLIESLASVAGNRFAVIGIGINLQPLASGPKLHGEQAPAGSQEAPGAARAVEASGAGSEISNEFSNECASKYSSEYSSEYSSGYASLSEIWPHVVPQRFPAEVLGVVLPCVLRTVRTFERSGFLPFVERFGAFDVLRGRMVRTFGPSGTGTDSRSGNGTEQRGIAVGIDAQGSLLVRVDGRVRIVISGEVSVRFDGSESNSMVGATAARGATDTGSENPPTMLLTTRSPTPPTAPSTAPSTTLPTPPLAPPSTERGR